MSLDDIILYEKLKNDRILRGICSLFYKGTKEEAIKLCGDLISELDSLGLGGNLFYAYITYLLVNDENSFSKACELRDGCSGTLADFAKSDAKVFLELFRLDLSELDEKYGISCFKKIKNYADAGTGGKAYGRRIRERMALLCASLQNANTADETVAALMGFYKDYGVGKYGLHKAFRIRETGDGGFEVEAIEKTADVRLDDLVGYEGAKKKLTDNTDAFVSDRKANNCLLFGDHIK